MARLKHVFPSHSQLAHVWAHQNQVEGRASSMFFLSNKIYSHGHHYLAAQIHTFKGKKFALVRSDTYSSSTSKHLAEIRGALQGLMPYFQADNVSDPSSAVKYLDNKVLKSLDAALKRKFYADGWANGREQSKNELERIHHFAATANELRAILGRKPFKMPAKKYVDVLAHLGKLEERYNSPERVAKRKLKAEAQDRKNEAFRREHAAREAESISNFRGGLDFNYWGADYDLLRVKDKRVETSGGAEVPLKSALALLQAIDTQQDVIGARVGAFTVDCFGTDEETGDTYIKIGCHKIMLSEARSVLAEFAKTYKPAKTVMKLKLVTA